jgi:hypothetical protein
MARSAVPVIAPLHMFHNSLARRTPSEPSRARNRATGWRLKLKPTLHNPR